MQANIAPAPVASHTTAARRIDLRDTLAELLQRVVPGYLTITGDADVDLLRYDATDAAEALVEELALQGFAIVREAALMSRSADSFRALAVLLGVWGATERKSYARAGSSGSSSAEAGSRSSSCCAC